MSGRVRRKVILEITAFVRVGQNIFRQLVKKMFSRVRSLDAL